MLYLVGCAVPHTILYTFSLTDTSPKLTCPFSLQWRRLPIAITCFASWSVHNARINRLHDECQLVVRERTQILPGKASHRNCLHWISLLILLSRSMCALYLVLSASTCFIAVLRNLKNAPALRLNRVRSIMLSSRPALSPSAISGSQVALPQVCRTGI